MLVTGLSNPIPDLTVIPLKSQHVGELDPNNKNTVHSIISLN